MTDKSTANFLVAPGDAFGRWLDEHPRQVVVLVAAVYAAFLIPVAWAKPLWHDELYTYNLALLPSVPSMLRGVQRIDLNPPLLYLLDFVTLRLPGVLAHEHAIRLAARLPSLMGGLIASLGLFSWLRWRVGALYALVGVGLIWNTAFYSYTVEDRPYALLMGATVLLMLAWKSPLRREYRAAWVLTNFLLAMVIAALHFMGAFVLLAFLAAACVEFFERGRVDIPLVLSYVLPFAILLLYHHMISGYGTLVFPPLFTPGLRAPLIIYAALGFISWFYAAAGGLEWLLSRFSKRQAEGSGSRETDSKESACKMPMSERALLLGLLLEPMVAMAAVWKSHGAFFYRYGLPACIPIAIGIMYLLRAQLRTSRVAGVVSILLLSIFPAWAAIRDPGMLQTGAAAESDPKASVPDYHQVAPDLPFVVASGLTYIEMNHRESPPFLHRVYYLTNTEGAIKYAHSTLFEQEEVVRETFHFPSRVEPLVKFESEHNRFLVLGTFDYPEDWLLRKLKADGDDVHFLGNYPTSYKDAQLYEIILPHDRP